MENGFVDLDDDYYVTNNPLVRSGVTAESVKWAFTTTATNNWHPLTWISHMLDCQLYGQNPIGHHLTSVLFHVANVLLLFLVLWKLTGAPWRSAVVAALFAIHPLHVESVAWVSERKDVLSTFFWMLTVLAYIAYVRRGGLARYALVVILYALGLMAKPMLVSLPIVLLILDDWPLNRTANLTNPTSWARLVVEKVPLFILAAASCIVTYGIHGAAPKLSRLGDVPLALRIDNALVSYAAYLGKMLWPAKLAALYPHPLGSLPLWQVIGSGLLLVLISTVAFLARKRRPYVLMGWLWYVVTLIPVIGLVQTGEQAMADRYTYIPLTGIFVIIVWGVFDLLGDGIEFRRRLALITAGVALFAALIVGTRIQVGYWRDSISLFGHTLDITRNNYVAHLNLGVALDRAGDTEGAKHHIEETLRLQPKHPRALYDYGLILSKSGDPEGAIIFYRRALKVWPRYADAHYNLGLAYDGQGKLDAAAREYEAAIRIAPDYVAAHNNLAIVLYTTGNCKEAWRHVHAAQALGFQPHPGFLQALSSKMPEP